MKVLLEMVLTIIAGLVLYWNLSISAHDMPLTSLQWWISFPFAVVVNILIFKGIRVSLTNLT